jgi:hypothetical protein
MINDRLMSLRKVIAGFILRITGTVWARCRGFRIACFACGYGLGCNLRAGFAYSCRWFSSLEQVLHIRHCWVSELEQVSRISYHSVSKLEHLRYSVTAGFQRQGSWRTQLLLGFNFRAGFAHSYYWVSTLQQVSHITTTGFNVRAGFAHSYYWVSTLEQVSHTATTGFQR